MAEGIWGSADFIAWHNAESASRGKSFEERRFYCDEGDLFHEGDKTYAFTNQWGHRCIEAIDQLIEAFPDEPVSYPAADS